MISVSGRKWQEKKINKKIVEKVHQDYKFSKILSQLIVSRKFNHEEIHLINNDLNLSNIQMSLYVFEVASDYLTLTIL